MKAPGWLATHRLLLFPLPYSFTANLEDDITLEGYAYGLTLGYALEDVELSYGLRLHRINHDYESSALSVLDGDYDQLYQIAGIGILFQERPSLANIPLSKKMLGTNAKEQIQLVY